MGLKPTGEIRKSNPWQLNADQNLSRPFSSWDRRGPAYRADPGYYPICLRAFENLLSLISISFLFCAQILRLLHGEFAHGDIFGSLAIKNAIVDMRAVWLRNGFAFFDILLTPFSCSAFRSRNISDVANRDSYEWPETVTIGFRYVHSWKRQCRFHLALFEILLVSLH